MFLTLDLTSLTGDQVTLIVSSTVTLLVAFLGIGGTLWASIISTSSTSKRELQASKSAAIIGLLDLWGSMLGTEHDGISVGRGRVELGSAAARLFLNLKRTETDPIMQIVNYTTSTFILELGSQERAAHIASAQNALQRWHLGRASASKALSFYRRQLQTMGYDTPSPPKETR